MRVGSVSNFKSFNRFESFQKLYKFQQVGDDGGQGSNGFNSVESSKSLKSFQRSGMRVGRVSIVLKMLKVPIITAVGGTWADLPAVRVLPAVRALPGSGLAPQSDLPFPARALPFHPDGLSGGVAAPDARSGEIPLISLFVSGSRSLPLAIFGFPFRFPLEFGWR